MMKPPNVNAPMLHGLPLTRDLPNAPRLPGVTLRSALLNALAGAPGASGKANEKPDQLSPPVQVSPMKPNHMPVTLRR